MSPQRRTALVSVAAATALIAIKLGAGLATGSLGLLSEAAHSGIDLIAALLTFFAIGVAGRPPDRSHPYGHGKAEHLAALAEAGILVGIAIAIAAAAAARLVRGGGHEVDAAGWALGVIGLVIVIDASRTIVSLRGARRFGSPALATNALHFGSDLAGSAAVLAGLLGARAGHPGADAVAALFVGFLVLAAAARLVRRNVDVLMDRSPSGAHEAALRAIEGMEEDVDVRRLRMRSAAGRHFADVVIGVPPAGGVGQGHATASAVEEAVEAAVPGADVVVHVEPREGAGLRERAHAAALAVPGVREIHNVVVVQAGDGTEISLHLKLPGGLTLDAAHALASRVEEAIRAAVPDVDAVITHLEPLSEPESGLAPQPDAEAEASALVCRIVRNATGREPRALRFLATERGLVAHLTLGLDPAGALVDAHALASEIEERIRRDDPRIADVVVHTEP